MKDTRYQASVWMAIFPFFTLFKMDIFSFAGKISQKFPSDIYIYMDNRLQPVLGGSLFYFLLENL